MKNPIMKTLAAQSRVEEKRLLAALFFAISAHLLLVFIFKDIANSPKPSNIAPIKLLTVTLSYFTAEPKSPSSENNATNATNATEEIVSKTPSKVDTKISSSTTDKSPVDPIRKEIDEKPSQETTLVLSQKTLRKWIDEDTAKSFDENSESYTQFENSFKSPGTEKDPRRNEADYLNSKNKSIDVRNNSIAHVQSKVFGRNACYKFDASPPPAFQGTLDGGLGASGVASVAFPYRCPDKKSSFKLTKR